MNQVYPSGKTDLFAGEQLVLVGRYSESGPVQISAKGKIGERDEEKTFEGTLTSKSEDSTNAFVERIWAMRRIGEISTSSTSARIKNSLTNSWRPESTES